MNVSSKQLQDCKTQSPTTVGIFINGFTYSGYGVNNDTISFFNKIVGDSSTTTGSILSPFWCVQHMTEIKDSSSDVANTHSADSARLPH